MFKDLIRLKSRIRAVFFIAVIFMLYSAISFSFTQRANASGPIGVELKGGAYFQHLSGSVSVGNSGGLLVPTTITPSNIGLQTSQTEPIGKIVFNVLYSNRISFSYVPYNYTGSKTISESINFNGQPYNVNTYVTSKLDLNSYKLFYTHNFSISRYVEIGFGVGVDVFTATAELDSQQYGNQSKSVGAPIPLIGARLKISPTNLLSFVGKLQGFSTGSKGYYYHYNLGLNVKPIPLLAVFAGYNYDNIHLNTNSVDGTMTFSGPEVELRLKF
jgi:hypothetical protein